MIDKIKIALANLKKAPADVQTAADAFQTAWARSQKANDQLNKWRAESKAAQDALDAADAALTAAIDKWDPVGKKNPTPEEKV